MISLRRFINPQICNDAVFLTGSGLLQNKSWAPTGVSVYKVPFYKRKLKFVPLSEKKVVRL